MVEVRRLHVQLVGVVLFVAWARMLDEAMEARRDIAENLERKRIQEVELDFVLVRHPPLDWW